MTSTTPPEQPKACKENPFRQEILQCPDCGANITFDPDSIEARCWNCREFFYRPRSRPATAPMLNSTDLLLLANDEWKRRQERKHLHDNVAWVSGFVGGFLTDKWWAADYVAKLHKQSIEARK